MQPQRITTNINLDIKNTLEIFCTFFDEEYLSVNDDIETLKRNYMRNLYKLNKDKIHL